MSRIFSEDVRCGINIRRGYNSFLDLKFTRLSKVSVPNYPKIVFMPVHPSYFRSLRLNSICIPYRFNIPRCAKVGVINIQINQRN